MANKTVHAVVARRGYTYRDTPIGVGRVVRLSSEQLDKAKRVNPPYFREATEAEVKAASTILDLSSIHATPAENAVEAQRAIDEGAAPKKK